MPRTKKKRDPKLYTEIIVEKPTRDMWTKSLQEILDSTPGSHFGLKPVSLVTKYFFDYSVFDNKEEEYAALAQDDLSKKLAEILDLKSRVKVGNGVYHWCDKNQKALEQKVKKTLGPEFVQYIEPKLVLICEDKLKGSINDILDLFK